MAKNNWQQWFSRLNLWNSPQTKARTARRHRARPILEMLEERLAPAISINDPSVVEGAGGANTALVFTVTRTDIAAVATVDFATASGTALAGTDYLADFGTVTFGAGEPTQDITINVLNDALDEADETFRVILSNAVGDTIADFQGVGTIIDDDPTPTLSINNVTVNENDGTAAFTVTLSAASGQFVSVDYATSNGTAESGSDYTGVTGTATFAAGVTTATINVAILNDALDEPDTETFNVTLSNPNNATIADGDGIGTINDDDPLPVLSIDDVSVSESAGTATFTVTLDAASAKTVTVDVASANGTAVAPGDYEAVTTTTLTFDPGETSKNVIVTIKEDLIDEDNETYTLNLSNADNATIDDGEGLGTIVDNDDPPNLAIDSVTVDEGAGTATFTVTLTGATEKVVTVDVASADGTATSTAPADFAAVPATTLTFNPGVTTQTVNVTINDDDIDEFDEEFTLNLTNAVNASIATATGTGTITDNDPAPALAIDDVTVDEDAGTATFTVTLTGATEKTVTVDVASADDTAVAPGDYTAISTTLTFAPGETTKSVSVTIMDDSIDEFTETFTLSLSGETNATLADGEGVGTINDNDPEPTLAIDDVTVDEAAGTATFSVTLTGATEKTVTVDVASADGTATSVAPIDFTAVPTTTLTFNPGVTTQTVDVAISEDDIDEFVETFTLNLTNSSNATIAKAEGVGTITDNDDLATLAIDNVTVDESAGTATFTVTLTGATEKTVTVDVASADDTATSTAPIDYTAVLTTLTFNPGETTKTVDVAINNDDIDEFDETFFVNLSNQTNADISDASGIGTITDNEPLVTLAIDDVTVGEGDGTAVFTVTLTGATEKTVNVNFATANFTAAAPSDYTSTTGTLTFAPGETTNSISVTIVDDNIEEDDLEFYFVDLSNPVNAAFTISGGVGTIIDDDPMVSINDVTVDENTGLASFTVSLTTTSTQVVTVDYATANGTAIVGNDYVAANGTLTFAPGETSKTLSVTVLNDLLDEANTEDFFVNLSNAVNATIDDGQGEGTIDDDDPLPALNVNDISVDESGTATFTVSLSAASGRTVTVEASTNNGSATAPGDYTGITSQLITFAAGETQKTVNVTLTDDAVDEFDETFTFDLANATNANIADGAGTATIVDNDAAPTVSISATNSPVTEGAGATFDITLSATSEKPVTVTFATADGTAAGGLDYENNSNSVTFTAGTTTLTQSITINTIDDSIDEPDGQTFLVNLLNPINATLATAQATGVINDNDAGPSISISDATTTEGGNVIFTLSLSSASEQAITVDVASSNGSAAAPGDYTALAAGTQLTFSAGQVAQTVTIATIDDAVDEFDETFHVTLSNPVNASLSDANAIGTILDNDAAPTVSIVANAATVTEGGAATFDIVLSATSEKPVTVAFATADGTANADDYTSTSGSVTFAAGTTTLTQTISINTIDDSIDEPDGQTFVVNLLNPINATLGTAQATGVINDNDSGPSISISDATTTEGGDVIFILTLSAASEQIIAVDVVSSDVTAAAPADYAAIAANTQVTFAAGQVSRTVSVSTVADTTDEFDEHFNVTLANPVNTSIADGVAVGTILDNDDAPTVSISPNAATVTEGAAATFDITLSATSEKPVTVAFATADGSANAADYQNTSGSVTFAAGTTTLTQTISINTIDDSIDEPDGQTFLVNLLNPINATLGTAQATGVINDNDSGPSISISDVTTGEGGNAIFTLTLSSASEQAVTVDVASADGSAVAPGDYTAIAANTTVAFNPGQTARTLSVATIADGVDEFDETFNVTLSNAVNASLSDADAIGTILDGDGAPVVSIVANAATVTEGAAATFDITLSATSEKPVTVAFATADGSANAADYQNTSGSVTFAAGTTTLTQTISINTIDDSIDEPDGQSFLVNLLNPINATLGTAQATGVINDNDSGPSISISDVTTGEGGAAIFTLTLSSASEQAVTVDVASADGSAVAPGDYTAIAANTKVTFAAGEVSRTLTVATAADAVDEFDENFIVTLANAVNASIADAEAVATILDDDDAPTVSISPNAANVTEGAGATFNVTLSATSEKPVTVSFATADGSANTADYQDTSGSITFAAGTTTLTQTITVSTIDDGVDEPDGQTFFVNLLNPINGTLATGQATGVINDNDGGPSISISDVTTSEGGNAIFTLTLSSASEQAITVDVASADGSAIAPGDYTAIAANTTVAFNPGQTARTLSVATIADGVDEFDETFNVTLSNAVNASLSDADAVGTILDGDGAPVVSIVANAATVTEGGAATFDIILTGATSKPVTVIYATHDVTAAAGQDYDGTFASVTFAGPGTQTVTINTTDDSLDENDGETFLVNLVSASNAVIDAINNSATGVINDNDAPPAISINDVTITEGNTGTVNAAFTVSLSAASGRAVTVDYTTADNSATAPGDYVAVTTPQTLTFAAGQTSQTISIVVNADLVDEFDETFFVNLANGLSGTDAVTISDNQGVGAILDDDAAPTVSIVATNSPVVEGAGATFDIVLSATSEKPVTVTFATSDGTAAGGQDYQSTTNSVTFAAGTTTLTQSIIINTIDDSIDEPDGQNFFVNLLNPVNVTLGTAQAIGVINDNDAGPSISISDVTTTEGGDAIFTLSLSAASEQTITVDVASADGAALAPGDYTALAGGTQVTFNPGQTSQTLSVATIDDAVDENDESFGVVLSNAVNASISDATATGTIIDNDAAPVVSIVANAATVTEGGGATFDISLSATSEKAVTVNFGTADVAALAGQDYQGTFGSVTFAAGTTTLTQTITINTIDDSVDEADGETFTVNLLSAVDATIDAVDNSAIGVINDNDAPPTISINDVTVTEGDSGTVDATFTVSLSAASGRAVTVDYATADGSAAAPGDYVAVTTPQTMTFAAGQTSRTISIVVNADLVDEFDETFFVNLANGLSGADAVTITDNQGVGTILDDDAAPTVSIAATNSPVVEGAGATFDIILSATSEKPVTVSFATLDGSAAGGQDYQGATNSVTFAAGTTTLTQSITVNTIDDAIDEPDGQDFFVNLHNPINATLATAQATGVINDNDAGPSISISDATTNEGGDAIFTLSLSTASEQTITVDVASADGTAAAPGDYTSLAGGTQVTFTPGQTSQTLSVSTAADGVDEFDETISVILSNAVNASLSDASAIGTILDNDAAPTVSIAANSGTVTEGVGATFDITLSAISEKGVTVNFGTADEIALAGQDYQGTFGSVTFAAGTTTLTQTISISTIDDSMDEANIESFLVNLISANNAGIDLGNKTATGLILDNDAPPTISINDVAVTEGSAGSVDATFTVSLSEASGRAISVDFTTADGSANAPGDYTGVTTPQTLTFAAGQTTRTISIAVASDTIDEFDETFFVNLANGVSGIDTVTILDGQGIGTILDDDAAPTVSISATNSPVTEGAGATFDITLSATSEKTVSVIYGTQDGSAIGGQDYQFAFGSVTFAAGTTTLTQTVTINTFDDAIDEADGETFQVNLLTPTNATIGAPGSATGIINDNDGTPTLSIDDVTVAESAGTATFTVSLSAASGQTVMVDFATSNGTAQAPADFTAGNGTLTFAPGVTSQTVTVAIINDVIDEFDENFTVNLSTPSNATINDGTGQGTIVDDDDSPTVVIDDVSVDEGAGIATFTVSLNTASEKPITVDFATADGTALAPADYTSTNGTLTFAPGTTTQTIDVVIIEDGTVELDETYVVNLSNPSNAIVLDNQGLGTIRDNETDGIQLATERNFFIDSAGLFENFVAKEKWIRGDPNKFGETWYYITPEGNLVEWAGKKGLGGNLLAVLDPIFYEDPELLVNASTLTAANPAELQAADEERKFYRSSVGNFYFNIFGGDEKWIKGQKDAKQTGQDNPWYFILPTGEVREWDGTRLTLSGDRVSSISLDADLYEDPSLLYNAFQDPSVNSGGFDVQHNFFTSRGNKGSEKSARNYYEDLFGSDEKWFLGDEDGTGNPWYFLQTNGNLSKWDGTAGSASGTFLMNLGENAWNNIEQVINDFKPALTSAQNQQLMTLDSQHSLFRASNDGDYFFDDLGDKEKRIRGKTNSFGNPWYLLLQDGSLLEWDGSNKAEGKLLATLPVEVYHDPLLLIDAFADGSVLNGDD